MTDDVELPDEPVSDTLEPSEFVKLRSWHLESGLISRGGMIHTLCGRWAPQGAETTRDLASNQKTCEKCFQLREQAR